MNERKKVLYVSQEIMPYLPETPLSKYGRDLPQFTHEKGYEVRTFMPKYGMINERRNQLHEVIRLSGMNIAIDETDHPLIIKVATMQPSRMQVYFIDNEDFFHYSPEKKLETITSTSDNDERILFFARGVIETVKKLRWSPAIMNCTGWVTSLVPIFIKQHFISDPTFANTKIVYTLRSESFENNLDERFAEKLKMSNLPDEALKTVADSAVDFVALNKLAIDFADAIIIADAEVPTELVEYAQNSGKPLMLATDTADETLSKYTDFYETL